MKLLNQIIVIMNCQAITNSSLSLNILIRWKIVTLIVIQLLILYYSVNSSRIMYIWKRKFKYIRLNKQIMSLSDFEKLKLKSLRKYKSIVDPISPSDKLVI